MKRAGIVVALWLALVSASPPADVAVELITGETLPPKLSDYRFFIGAKPNARVQPYSLTTPLFSDYSEKDRYVFVPPGAKAAYRETGVIDLPVGSALIKTFGYGARKIETRVLLRRASGWVALPYVWNDDGSEAVLKRSGTRVDIAFTTPAGAQKSISYAVPNVNQCKECHALSGVMMPIGPKARNLDAGQLAHWRAVGLLDRAPAGPKMARWDDVKASLDGRARAYLDVNCGHCHNPAGSASNSGLYLTAETIDRVAIGIGKRPVAAGRGSGGREVAIEPGAPQQSIMTFRMASTEPGVAMPEVGRAIAHTEGVALLEQWIAGMKH